MYLRTLELRNLRCFESASLQFQFPGRKAKVGEPPVATLDNVNLILGNNGAGKSTILKGAALALLAPALQNSGFFAYSLVRRDFHAAANRSLPLTEARARVVLTRQDTGKQAAQEAELFTLLSRDGDEDTIVDTTPRGGLFAPMQSKESPAFLVLGYGATRRMAPAKEFITTRSKHTNLRYQRVQSLFDEELTMVQLAHWLPQFSNAGRTKQVIHLMDELLGNQYRFTGIYRGGEYFVEKDGTEIPFAALSDGYRAFIGWISDLLYHVCFWSKSGAKLRDIEGVVMVDEIDLHLHPDWQRSIILTLASTFRRLQFIFTSHSPLITGSLEWPNIWVMRDGTPVQLPDEPINGLSADQVLLSPYFGVRATRADVKMERLRELETRAQRGDPEAAASFMRELSTGLEAGKYGTSGGKGRAAKAGIGKALRALVDRYDVAPAPPEPPAMVSKKPGPAKRARIRKR